MLINCYLLLSCSKKSFFANVRAVMEAYCEKEPLYVCLYKLATTKTHDADFFTDTQIYCFWPEKMFYIIDTVIIMFWKKHLIPFYISVDVLCKKNICLDKKRSSDLSCWINWHFFIIDCNVRMCGNNSPQSKLEMEVMVKKNLI